MEDDKISGRPGLATALTSEETKQLTDMAGAIKEARAPDDQAIRAYNEIVIKKLLPLNFITHNAVILFVLDIFDRFPEVRNFYQNYYPLIVVDEFQDTNCIALKLLESIIVYNRTQLVFLGDPLQRIYGFIGALPNIMGTIARKYSMTPVVLEKNYRFRDSPEMLKLDKNIRANAAAAFAPAIENEDNAMLPAFWGSTQQEEAQKIVTKVQSLIASSTDRVAILFRARGLNADVVEGELSARGVPYFYGMFSDEDPEYVIPHQMPRYVLWKFGKSKTISQKALHTFVESVEAACASETGKTIDSLLRLLNALSQRCLWTMRSFSPTTNMNCSWTYSKTGKSNRRWNMWITSDSLHRPRCKRVGMGLCCFGRP